MENGVGNLIAPQQGGIAPEAVAENTSRWGQFVTQVKTSPELQAVLFGIANQAGQGANLGDAVGATSRKYAEVQAKEKQNRDAKEVQQYNRNTAEKTAAQKQANSDRTYERNVNADKSLDEYRKGSLKVQDRNSRKPTAGTQLKPGDLENKAWKTAVDIIGDPPLAGTPEEIAAHRQQIIQMQQRVLRSLKGEGEPTPAAPTAPPPIESLTSENWKAIKTDPAARAKAVRMYGEKLVAENLVWRFAPQNSSLSDQYVDELPPPGESVTRRRALSNRSK